MSELRVGTSGWQYKHWKGRFYPKDLPTARWLEYYTRIFDTVELNNPFYRQPERKTFEKWRRSVPDDFVYAVKLNRFITHIKRLNIERDSVERSYGTLAGLGPKAAVVLVQLPPRMKFDQARAERFFKMVAPPLVGESVVVRIEMVVVFPAPFGPSSTKNSPGFTWKEMPSTAFVSAFL